ncbi:MAG: hypothetical protein U0132_02345 [Gemmatimonadaceae bacterium]
MKYALTLLLAAGAVTACQDATAPRAAGPSPVAASTSAAPSVDPRIPIPSNMFAVVSGAGSLMSGSNALSVTASGFGVYEVFFNRNVSSCAYVATTVNGTASQTAQVFTASGHSSPNAVYVETKNQGGGLSPQAFHLVVSCGIAMPFAVVDYNGNLTRASGPVSISGGNGIYRINFGFSVAPCAYIATVADPGNGLVFSPAGVYTASGSVLGEVYVETKNPGGGLQAGVPFHLMLICTGTSRTGYAVVKSTGTFQRGSPPGGSITHPSTGHYTINAPFQISACAKVLTRGSFNTAVPFTPTTVELGSSSTATSLPVEVRNLPLLGGAFVDESFHVAVVC